MSSESSAGEGEIEDVYRVKFLPWRRNVEAEMDFIDRARCSAKLIIENRATDEEERYGFGAQGSKPIRRMRDATRGWVSRRPDAQGLSKELYDKAYIEGLPPAQLKALSVSREQFEWIQFMYTEW